MVFFKIIFSLQMIKKWLPFVIFHTELHAINSSLFSQPSFNLYVTVDDSVVYKPPPEVPKVTG